RRIRMSVRFHRREMRDPRVERPLTSPEEMRGDVTSPSLAASRRESTLRLREAMELLPEEGRRIVELHSFRGLSFPEVAGRLGLSGPEAARYRFHEALKRIGRILSTGGPPPA
ncbi:MAG: RNA polymerase sigma factor, partial [Planctomycetota bacterium]